MTTSVQERVNAMTPQQRIELARLAIPRIVEPYTRHIPHPTQQVFLALNGRREVLFGGAAGGGKSDALLMAALQYVDVPGYAALLLRKTWPDLVLPGAIMDRAFQWLDGTPAKRRDGGRLWEFPSGARLQFGHLQHDEDKHKYRSSEFQFIGFDELTQWADEATFAYLHSRLRKPALSCINCGSTLARSRDHKTGKVSYRHKKSRANSYRPDCRKVFPDPKVIEQYQPARDGTTVFDVPIRMRAATNPGGKGTEWVKKRFIDPRTKRKDNVFVPSLLKDNPSLDEEEYGESLEYLDHVNKMRLLHGDWDVVEQGDMFDRSRFVYVDERPDNIVEECRFWDMAASENQGDYTVGALVGLLDDNTVVVLDIVRRRKRPHEMKQIMRATARIDGLDIRQRMEQEGGSAGVIVVDDFRTSVFPGYNFDGIKSTGSKEARAMALASFARGRKVKVLVAQWNHDFLNEFEQFPNGNNDDQVDATAGAFNELMFGARARLLV